MATLYTAQGHQEEIHAVEYGEFTDYELKQYVKGDFNKLIIGTQVMVINVDARDEGQPLNIKASEKMRPEGYNIQLFGDVLLCSTDEIN